MFTRYILNIIGGTVRWIVGSLWRTIFNKPKFTYKEYIYGPKQSKDYYDEYGHRFNNSFIGVICILILIALFV